MKNIKEGLPVETLDSGSTMKDIQNAVGESAKRIREETGTHPLKAWRDAYQTARENTGNKIPECDY